MPKSRPALDALKAELLKKSDGPQETVAIAAAFDVFTELLDNTGRIADALEAKAKA